MKEYELSIDPSILELLGPNLYTNVYYVLAELIANAYDADAKNVYIIENRDYIKVEDDGHGMSYDDNEIKKYLDVAATSRTSEEDSKTKLGRYKMGRKGVGKLAALSISENVDVLTISKGDKSGFILSRKLGKDKKLQPIDEENIHFENIKEHGTAIIMRQPEYRLNKGLDIVKRNLLKIFPLIDKEFRIHYIKDGQPKATLDGIDKGIIPDLCTVITLGDDFKYLGELVHNPYAQEDPNLIEHREEMKISLKMENKTGEKKEYELIIKGWIGAYKSTRGRRRPMADFPDNFISLFANKKMGEFNILPIVGKNRLYDVYVVGQLHVDIFELSELPDMALSNRQGYKFDDARYQKVINYVKDTLLPNITEKRQTFTDLKNKEKQEAEYEYNKNEEEKFNGIVRDFQKKASAEAASSIVESNPSLDVAKIEPIIAESINNNKSKLGLKTEIDDRKKKILISQTEKDRDFSDIIYKMLIYNNIPAKDILYTICEDAESRIPQGKKVYDYLREFFIDSYSNEKPYIIFVTSEYTPASWGVMLEIGAHWITQVNHEIFTIDPFKPEKPLDNAEEWQVTQRDDKNLWVKTFQADIFCEKIKKICDTLGYNQREKNENLEYLNSLISVGEQ